MLQYCQYFLGLGDDVNMLRGTHNFTNVEGLNLIVFKVPTNMSEGERLWFRPARNSTPSNLTYDIKEILLFEGNYRDRSPAFFKKL